MHLIPGMTIDVLLKKRRSYLVLKTGSSGITVGEKLIYRV